MSVAFVVHSMKRTGSRTVRDALINAGYQTEYIHWMTEDGITAQELSSLADTVWVISLIRNPIDRLFSLYYYAPVMPLDDMLKSVDDGSVWIKEELVLWGINSINFPKDTGYIVTGNNVIIRLEKLNDVWDTVWNEMGLPLPAPTLITVGDVEWQPHKVEDSDVDKIMTSDFTQTFFSQADVDEARIKYA